MRSDVTSRHLELHRNILSELDHTLGAGARVLDFGCGAGKMVEEYCAAGYDAFGCDIRVAHESERVRPLDEKTRSLPFADATFDFVFSDQVLEHVDDLLAVLGKQFGHALIITNEVGMGIVPKSALGRQFRDVAGLAHQRLSQAADEVYLAVLGTILRIKPGPGFIQ